MMIFGHCGYFLSRYPKIVSKHENANQTAPMYLTFTKGTCKLPSHYYCSMVFLPLLLNC
jgi:hypothetical protein